MACLHPNIQTVVDLTRICGACRDLDPGGHDSLWKPEDRYTDPGERSPLVNELCSLELHQKPE